MEYITGGEATTIGEWLKEFAAEWEEEITHVQIEGVTFVVSDLTSELLDGRFYSNGDEDGVDMAWSLNYVISMDWDDFQDYPRVNVVSRNPL